MFKKSNKGDDIDEESSDAPSSDIESDSDETGKEEANITSTLLVVSMTGSSQPQTLKLFVHVKNTKVMVLVDCGSTHNFIGSRVAKKLIPVMVMFKNQAMHLPLTQSQIAMKLENSRLTSHQCSQ